jgi:diguanylate cyclase (GGDEF)-like protein
VWPSLLLQDRADEVPFEFTGPDGEAVPALANFRAVADPDHLDAAIHVAVLTAPRRRSREKELVRSRREVIEDRDRLDKAQRFTRPFSDADDVAAVVEAVLSGSLSVLGADQARLWRIGTPSELLGERSHDGKDVAFGAEATGPSGVSPIAQRSIDSGQLTIEPCGDGRTALALPLIGEGFVFAVLDLEFPDDRADPEVGKLIAEASATALLQAEALAQERTARLVAEHDAGTDPLTGVANRRSFLAALDKELSRPRQPLEVSGLLLIDLDHFKEVNDRHGHTSGDHVLVGTVRRMQRRLRRADLLARWGGEEFVVFCVGLPGPQALEMVADELRQCIARSPMMLPDGADITITASIGVAFATPGVVGLTELLEQADAALYQAKASGRNATKVFQG